MKIITGLIVGVASILKGYHRRGRTTVGRDPKGVSGRQQNLVVPWRFDSENSLKLLPK
jgi:hypothetical protein